jgi:carbon-monoxide dehydrogenase medium subunit
VKPAPFEYHAPESIEEVCGLLAEHGDDAKVLAGGQSLVPMLALRLTHFEHLVDVNRVAHLAGVGRENGTLVVGAGTRQRVLERDATLAAAVPLLAEATPLIGHFQIRNRGTVGGSLAHADPASEYPAVAVALGAELELAGVGGRRRRVAADDFFLGTWTTAAEPDELLVAAHFPVWPARSGFAIEEVARRHGDFALAGVACAVADGRAGVALFGVGSTPVRARAAEEALVTGASPADVAAAAVAELDPPADVHASAATRVRIARHLVERAVVRAQEVFRAVG